MISSTSSNNDFEGEDWWISTNLDGIDDPEALRRFMGAYDYLFDCSDDDLDPSRSCFMAEVGIRMSRRRGMATTRQPQQTHLRPLRHRVAVRVLRPLHLCVLSSSSSER